MTIDPSRGYKRLQTIFEGFKDIAASIEEIEALGGMERAAVAIEERTQRAKVAEGTALENLKAVDARLEEASDELRRLDVAMADRRAEADAYVKRTLKDAAGDYNQALEKAVVNAAKIIAEAEEKAVAAKAEADRLVAFSGTKVREAKAEEDQVLDRVFLAREELTKLRHEIDELKRKIGAA